MRIRNKYNKILWEDKNVTTLSDANLSDADLSYADLSDANLRGATLRDADLSDADLSYADLSDANLRGADLRGATLRHADLRGATLSVADLKGADLSGATLRDADLKGADLSCATLSVADLKGADLSGATLRDADLKGADLSCATLSGAILINTNLKGATLSGVKGLMTSSEFLKQFATDELGILVYKRIGSTTFPLANHWEIKEGAVLTEVVNYTKTQECGCGVNFGNLEWCKQRHKTADLWLCRINWIDLADVVVPYNTDGKARCAKLTLLKKIQD